MSKLRILLLPALLLSAQVFAACPEGKQQADTTSACRSVSERSEIPYWSQLDNENEPLRTCSLTSMAMITDFFGVTNPQKLGMRTPDYLHQYFGGVLQTVPALRDGFNQLAEEMGSPVRNHGRENGTIDELRSLASRGIPTIIHGWFTASGHIVVVTGFDGEHYTVHDPFGRWNREKWGSYDTSVSGEGVRYPREAFEFAINDNGTGDDLWLHVFK
uniref:C39 family peptidase n=1 Tax=Microbulbifer agarilyticus TaxID=260552 RepID=UPI0002559799|nr:C39 family peptidase [Microbulbifer agarilyticus]